MSHKVLIVVVVFGLLVATLGVPAAPAQFESDEPSSGPGDKFAALVLSSVAAVSTGIAPNGGCEGGDGQGCPFQL